LQKPVIVDYDGLLRLARTIKNSTLKRVQLPFLGLRFTVNPQTARIAAATAPQSAAARSSARQLVRLILTTSARPTWNAKT
jgi:hypothetical protein